MSAQAAEIFEERLNALIIASRGSGLTYVEVMGTLEMVKIDTYNELNDVRNKKDDDDVQPE